MNKKTELITTKALVKAILEESIRARNSDSYLYMVVLNAVAADKKIDLASVTVTQYLLNMSMWGFPSFETVRRTRQKLQHDFPELAACEEVQAGRAENEMTFTEFARGELG